MYRLIFGAVLLAMTALASADDYHISIGTPLTGTSLPSGKVGLGIPVSVNKSWDQLSAKEQQAWREYTELLDPEVRPPFPTPHIRAFLSKLNLTEKFAIEQKIQREDEIYLVVRVSDKGEVSSVDLMRGADDKARELSDAEKVLAYRYVKALLATQFTPALYKGTPVASAFPMLVQFVTRLK